MADRPACIAGRHQGDQLLQRCTRLLSSRPSSATAHLSTNQTQLVILISCHWTVTRLGGRCVFIQVTFLRFSTLFIFFHVFV